MKIRENFTIAIVLGLTAGFWIYMTAELPKVVSGEKYGPAYFPRIIIFGLIVCSALFLFMGIKNFKKDQGVVLITKENTIKCLIFTVILSIYGVLFIKIGFIASSIMFLIVALWLFGVRSKKVFFLYSPVLVVLLNLLFSHVFSIPLP
ncbi:MAG: tripartite tricarboxylate transporter TctB family protein [Dehalobacterium sp.]